MQQTLYAYRHAFVQGTLKNREVQARLYIKFCLLYGINYLQPLIIDIAMYARFLGNSFASTGTLKNYLSGAKGWVQHHRGNIFAFSAPEVGDVIKYNASNSTHTPAPAYPLSPADFKIICKFLDSRPSLIPKTFKAVILIAFSSFLRASNLTSPTMSSWGGPHTLRASDVVLTSTELLLCVRSTKTQGKNSTTILPVWPSSDPDICPVRAWVDYYSTVRPCPLGPAFILPPAVPLTPRHIVSLMRLALQEAGRHYASLITMHSLRRGGVQTAAALGASTQQLMTHGTWNSEQTLNKYLSPNHRVVPRMLAKSLAA